MMAIRKLAEPLSVRMEALQRVKLDGFQMVISELEVVMDYRAGRSATWKREKGSRMAAH
jgi:hypothetical protein